MELYIQLFLGVLLIIVGSGSFIYLILQKEKSKTSILVSMTFVAMGLCFIFYNKIKKLDSKILTIEFEQIDKAIGNSPISYWSTALSDFPEVAHKGSYFYIPNKSTLIDSLEKAKTDSKIQELLKSGVKVNKAIIQNNFDYSVSVEKNKNSYLLNLDVTPK